MKEFIQQPLCMALQTPQVYNRKTFPHIIIRRLYVWYLKMYSPLPTSLHAHPTSLANKRVFPSPFSIACLP